MPRCRFTEFLAIRRRNSWRPYFRSLLGRQTAATRDFRKFTRYARHGTRRWNLSSQMSRRSIERREKKGRTIDMFNGKLSGWIRIRKFYIPPCYYCFQQVYLRRIEDKLAIINTVSVSKQFFPFFSHRNEVSQLRTVRVFNCPQTKRTIEIPWLVALRIPTTVTS